MATLTVRVDDAIADAIDDEADRLGFDNRTEYLRHILRHREESVDGASVTRYDIDTAFQRVTEKLDDVEAIFDDVQQLVEGNGVRDSAADAPEPRVASVDELDLQGAGDVLAARQAALTAVYERLQELGEATKQELLEVVDAEAVGYASADSFWSNVISGEGTLSRLPGVRAPEPGHGAVWRYSEMED